MFRLNNLKKQQTAENKDAAASSASSSSADSTSNGENGTNNKQEEAQAGVISLRKGPTTGGRRKNAAQIRVQKDMQELDLEDVPGTRLQYPDPDDIMHFYLFITPNEGLWDAATYQFEITIPNDYPYKPPKVLCKTMIYHPNIDWEGHVCLNILREDWKPVLHLRAVIIGLVHLFIEPNANDPLNKEAADHMNARKADFENTVKRTLRGGIHFDRQFPRLK